MNQSSGGGVGGISRVWVENWQVAERWRGAGLTSSSKGVVGEASQRWWRWRRRLWDPHTLRFQMA